MPTTPPSISPTLADILDDKAPVARLPVQPRGFRPPITDARRMRILQRTERKLAALLAKTPPPGRDRP